MYGDWGASSALAVVLLAAVGLALAVLRLFGPRSLRT